MSYKYSAIAFILITLASILNMYSTFQLYRSAKDRHEQHLKLVLSSLTYEKDIKPIFKARCYQCHNEHTSAPNWMDYKTAYEKRNQIRNRVWVTRTMPIGPITEKERESIKDWIDQGANR